jgi:MoaA/NifB/PqqE/SkfB family radical SAM enzyme
MTSENETQGYFLSPGWLVLDDGAWLEAVDYGDGTELELEGSLRSAVLSGQPDAGASLGVMARLDPAVGRFAEAFRKHRLVPLNRATLLEGAGFGQFFLELTARCNEQCVHCYADSSPYRTEALTRETMRSVLRDARELGFRVVQLTGGDPLVSPLCPEAAEYAAELGFPMVEVYTNGVALDGRLYERLREVGTSFAFSFYSHDAETHDAITRTPGSHARTVRAIQRVVRDGLPVRVSTVVMEQNAGQLDETQRFLQRLGVPEGALGADVQRSVGRGLHALRSSTGRTLTGPTGATAGAAPQGGGHAPRARGGLQGRAAVASDGTVYPCIFSRTFPLGSVYEQSLRSILTAPEPVRIERKRVLEDPDGWCSQLSCGDCRLRASVLASGSKCM